MGNFSAWLTAKAKSRIHDGLYDLRREIEKLPPDSYKEADIHLKELNQALLRPMRKLRAVCHVPYDLHDADGKPTEKME